MRHKTIYSLAWALASAITSAAILADCGLGTIVVARELTLQDF